VAHRSASNASEPVTVTIARRVAPGREAEFEQWAEELTRAAAAFPGFLGFGLLRPTHVGDDWHAVFRFDSAENLHRWEQSPIRAKLLADVEEFVRITGVQKVSGLETWFNLPGRTAPAPPRWKMFLVSGVAIYTVSLLLNLVADLVIGPLPLPLRLAPVSFGTTALITWLVMPRLARLLAGWLYAPSRQT
jgi:antibiotic biosynthesis monooxygenase (ABM) superfamily enzyme